MDFGVFREKTISDAKLRNDFIRGTSNDAVSKGRVSDGLSSKLRSEDDSSRPSSLRQESGAELSVDQGKPEDQQSGVSAEDADKRGVTAGKASRELDLDYDENIEATKTLTNRDILVNALENVTQSQDELDKLREYKKRRAKSKRSRSRNTRRNDNAEDLSP